MRVGRSLKLVVGVVAALVVSPSDTPAADLPVLVGTYTRPGGSEGIQRFVFDTDTGAMRPDGLAAAVTNPSFLAVHPTKDRVYAVAEVGSYEGREGGAVLAYRLDRPSGGLEPLGEAVESGGSYPCHLGVDPTGRFLVVANYGSGSVALFRLGDDGSLAGPCDVRRHTGKSVNPRRQEGPHAHGVTFAAGDAGLVVPDLGLDQLKRYQIDAEANRLEPGEPPAVAVTPGSGPRHLVFAADGQRAYVINEMASTITVFVAGWRELQTITTVPAAFEGSNTTAEIAVHPSGRFVYGSNRGHNSIAIFAVEEDGRLRALGHEPTRGKTPRSFVIDPTGRYLLAANQDSDSITVFRIDPRSGLLSALGEPVAVPAPVCVVFITPQGS